MTDLASREAAENFQAIEEADGGTSRTPGQLAWRQLRKNRFAMVSLYVLVALYLCAIFAEFLAPYPVEQQRRPLNFHPPTPLIFHDGSGGLSLRPYILGTEGDADSGYKPIPGIREPVRFFVHGYPYKLVWLIPSNIHLFGTRNRAPFFLLGSDEYGRDVFSRLLIGAQISLSVGLVGIMITFALGMLVGGISGYYGGRLDDVLMRMTEVIISIPGFYLLIALAAVIPPTFSPAFTYLLIIAILSFVGWAGLARVIRGMALAARENQYVEAARALGVGDLKIIGRHILPTTFTYAIVSATLAVPGYIIGEAGLSFLGLGIRDPMPSWGNMLSAAEDLTVLTHDYWLLTPGLLIFITVIAYNLLGDGLRDALDPKLRR